MRYGVPYKGSKNSIAKWIVSELPPAEYFVDLFCGGCAVTHAAMLSGKYKKFIINDIDGRMPRFFIDCIKGKYTLENHPEWISREKFEREKEQDAYIDICWSFGNNGKDYLYGKDVEPVKKTFHEAVYGDTRAFDDMGIKTPSDMPKEPYERYLSYLRLFNSEMVNLERLLGLERLQSLQSLQSLQRDYQEVDLPADSVIYCDIPYKGTKCGKYGGFNHERFYKWAENQENLYISEYDMPDNFVEFANIEKIILSAANGNDKKSVEKLFTNRKTYNKSNLRERRELNTAIQEKWF